MVAYFRAGLERSQPDAIPPAFSAYDIGRIGIMGLWSGVPQSVVPGRVAAKLGTGANCAQGAGSNCNGSGSAGPPKVCCLCDNAAVVAAVNKGSARDPALMRLIRLLTLLCTILNITVTARHLPGVQNASADALSRNELPVYFCLNPQASPVPAILPNELQELVFNRSLRWTSPDWMGLLSTTLIAALRLPHAQHTEQLSIRNSPSPLHSLLWAVRCRKSVPTKGEYSLPVRGLLRSRGPETQYN